MMYHQISSAILNDVIWMLLKMMDTRLRFEETMYKQLSCHHCVCWWLSLGHLQPRWHHCDVITSAMASQITGISIVCLTVCSGADQRKHQSSASLAFVRGIHMWPISIINGPVTRKMFPFDDVIIMATFGLLCMAHALEGLSSDELGMSIVLACVPCLRTLPACQLPEFYGWINMKVVYSIHLCVCLTNLSRFSHTLQVLSQC